jgi:hypothetical protein
MDFGKNVFFVFLNSPCYETPKKRLKKKSIKKQKATTFFLALRQMYVTFVIFVFAAPLAPDTIEIDAIPTRRERRTKRRGAKRTTAHST